MNDQLVLKIKLGLAVVSFILILAALGLLVGDSESQSWLMWFSVAIITFLNVNLTVRFIRSSRAIKVFYEFQVAGLITFAVVTVLATIMLLIFYWHISFSLLGMALICMALFSALRFITIDFATGTVSGLVGDQVSFNNINAYIAPRNNEIEITVSHRDVRVLLNKEMFDGDGWTKLTDSFRKINDVRN